MHLVVAITAHGFGHAAQVAPVINALAERLPSLKLTLLTGLPECFLRERISVPFRVVAQPADFGLVMNSSLDIDLESSALAYAKVHDNWDAHVTRNVQLLESLQPDLVLADIPYLTLEAAYHAGIPALALCSLNWADIYRAYFSARNESGQILEQMQNAYQRAAMFLCPEPSMPMTFLDNRRAIGPIARTGNKRRAELASRLAVSGETALVLVAPGGVQTRFAMEQWPRDRGIRWLVSAGWNVQHPDVSPLEPLGWSFTDLLASCDAVLGKCGYGTVAECVVNGTPLLYVTRPGWPEESCLARWLQSHRAGVAVDPQCLVSGDLERHVESARSLRVDVCEPVGIVQAAEAVADYALQSL